MRDALDQELTRLSKGQSTTMETLLRLLQAQIQVQQENRIERRIKESKLPERKTLNEFDFAFQPTLDKQLVMELHNMDFVGRNQGIILAGDSGTGKSHLGKAITLQGCKLGLRVRYTKAAEMLSTLFSSLADDSFEQVLKNYIQPQLLMIDELGFDRLEQHDARNAALFFKVIDGRYGRNSTILTTNIDFEQLGHYLGDPLVTTAIVDRMVHHSTVISIHGPSWRMRESAKLNNRQDPKKQGGINGISSTGKKADGRTEKISKDKTAAPKTTAAPSAKKAEASKRKKSPPRRT
jgi:DNA replication protein DnaC